LAAGDGLLEEAGKKNRALSEMRSIHRVRKGQKESGMTNKFQEDCRMGLSIWSQ
jgi:hypothetical protein